MKRTKNFQSKVTADAVKGGIPTGVNFPYVIIRAKMGLKRPKNGHFGSKTAPIALKFHTNMYSNGI